MCPICGKSSSAKSFPAGGGTDIILQTFQSLGRGKGFKVASRESGLDNRELGRAISPKLLRILSALVDHGHLSRTEVANAVGTGKTDGPDGLILVARSEIHALESELGLERKTRAFLEDEVTNLQLGLTRQARRLREAQRRANASQSYLEELRTTREHLVAATKDGVTSLQALRAQLRNAGHVDDDVLADHVQRMRAIVEVVRGLQRPERKKEGTGPEPHDTR